jgi:Flp pilus assembly protein TadG
MRRLTSDENGATAVIVAILLFVLVGLGAFVVDIGDVMWERRMLQNSADSAALAVAVDCVEQNCVGYSDTADSYAAANNWRGAEVVSVTGQNGVSPPTFSGREVTVVTRTSNDGQGRLRQWFSGVLGQEEGLVSGARATAAWRITGSATTIPLTFSECEWLKFTGGVTDPQTALPTDEETIVWHNAPNKNECDGPAGLDGPGGFGWLETLTAGPNGGKCLAEVQLGEADGKPGNTRPTPENQTGCTEEHFENLMGEVVLIPIHDTRTGSGNNLTYNIIGFAGFEVMGYKLSSSASQFRNPSDFTCPSAADEDTDDDHPGKGKDKDESNSVCMSGIFVEYHDLEGVPATEGVDFGAVSLGLTG